MPGGRTLTARIWQASVGRVPLLLLDSDIEENEDDLRGVTDRLYGGDQDQRIRQEILVGVGGVRAVRAYCELTGHPPPEVFHTNEGHAGYLGLERIRELQGSDGLSFDEALAAVRAGTVFTTHTPVPAGIDRFPIDLVQHYFGDADGGADSTLLPGVPMDRILALGAEDEPEHVQHGAHGPAAGPAGQRGLPAARRGVAGHVRQPVGGLRRRRGADRLGDQRCARADLGGPGDHRADRRARAGHLGGGVRRASCGRCAGCCAPGWWPRCAAGCARPGCSAARPPPSWAGPTTCSTRRS